MSLPVNILYEIWSHIDKVFFSVTLFLNSSGEEIPREIPLEIEIHKFSGSRNALIKIETSISKWYPERQMARSQNEHLLCARYCCCILRNKYCLCNYQSALRNRIQTYMYICLNIYIPKNILLNLYIFTCMHVFRPDHLVLDN